MSILLGRGVPVPSPTFCNGLVKGLLYKKSFTCPVDPFKLRLEKRKKYSLSYFIFCFFSVGRVGYTCFFSPIPNRESSYGCYGICCTCFFADTFTIIGSHFSLSDIALNVVLWYFFYRQFL